MKKYLLSFLHIVLLLVTILPSCTSSYRNTRLINDQIIASNKNKLRTITYGMTKKEVLKIMNQNLSSEAAKENPQYEAVFKGKASMNYTVQFYKCAEVSYKGNIKYRDERYFPCIFKDKLLVGINWDDYENLIGAAFVIADNKKAVSSIYDENERKDSLLSARGTGFLINNNGYVVTNYHVVEDTKTISVYSPVLKKLFKVSGFMKDIANDIALLKIEDSTYNNETFRKINFKIINQDEIKVGQDVFTLGFPFGAYLGTTTRLSNGTINSKLGFQDDPRTMQINNPLQPGNSGGPLFNMQGNLVGVVVSTIDASYVLYKTGRLPQNVNFAIKSDYLKIMLESAGLEIPKSDSVTVEESKLEDLVERLNEYIVMVICE